MVIKKIHKDIAKQELHKNAVCCLEQILEATPNKTAAVQPITSHLPLYSSMKQPTRRVFVGFSHLSEKKVKVQVVQPYSSMDTVSERSEQRIIGRLLPTNNSFLFF